MGEESKEFNFVPEDISPVKQFALKTDESVEGCYYENPDEKGCYHVKQSSLIKKDKEAGLLRDHKRSSMEVTSIKVFEYDQQEELKASIIKGEQDPDMTPHEIIDTKSLLTNMDDKKRARSRRRH